MITLVKIIQDAANVGPSFYPIPPFGPYDITKRNNTILSKMQNLNTLDPTEQSKKMKKILGER